MDEYKTRYKLDKEVLRRIPIPAYRVAKQKILVKLKQIQMKKGFWFRVTFHLLKVRIF